MPGRRWVFSDYKVGLQMVVAMLDVQPARNGWKADAKPLNADDTQSTFEEDGAFEMVVKASG